MSERDGEPGGEPGGGGGGNGGRGRDRAHARIEAALAKLGDDLSAPAGWQARVLAAVADPPRRRRWWWFAAPAFAAAAAIAIIVIWLVLRPPAGPSVALELALASDPTGAGARVRVRGTTANVGDVVTATARGDGKHRAVWIYRDRRELVIACPGASDCQMTSGAPTAVARLDLPGTYTIVALASSAPIPPPSPTASYDASMAAAASAGAVSRLETVTVR